MYTVHIEISASASNYWARMSFEDARGETHKREITMDRNASKQSNHLQALIDAVGILNRPCMLDVYTSCEYLIEPFKQGWIANWERNDWKTAKGKPVRNAEQWKRLKKAMAPHSTRYLYIDGRK